MTTRPLIGYASRSGLTTAALAVPRFANNESYAYAIAENGGAPLMIPSTENDKAILSVYTILDGLLLTGGPDIDPASYGQERHPLTDSGDARMEVAEALLVRRALADGLPILGICRGIQTLNVVGGGTLYQDVRDEFGGPIAHPADAMDRDRLVHSVVVGGDTRLGRVLGCAEIGVNSLHHQAVRDLAPGYAVTAVAPDGLIEAMERPDRPFVVAVQWHPEELYRSNGVWSRLFQSFVAAAGEYRERRARP